MQILTIAGNVGKEPTLRNTQSGDAVLGFSVAVDTGKDKNGNKRDPAWYDVAIWGKRGEALGNVISKGMKITVSGRPTARAYEGKAYMGISADQVTLQGGGNSTGGGGYDAPQGGPQGGAGPDMDDEIPFAPEWRV